jgi:hypothetical protein
VGLRRARRAARRGEVERHLRRGEGRING